MLSPLQIQSRAHLCSRLTIFWSKWGQTMLGQIGLIWLQSTILSYLRSLFSATPTKILLGHIFLNSTKINWSQLSLFMIPPTSHHKIPLESIQCINVEYWIAEAHFVLSLESSWIFFFSKAGKIFMSFHEVGKCNVLFPYSAYSIFYIKEVSLAN